MIKAKRDAEWTRQSDCGSAEYRFRRDIASPNTAFIADERSVVIEIRYSQDEAIAVTP